MQQQRVSGATFISAAATAKLHDHLSDLLERGIAVNTLDRDILGQQIDRVVFDHQKAGRDLTEHLISLGHRKIVFITYKGIKGTPAGRLKGYQEAMREANLQEIVVTEDKPVAQTAGDEMMLSYHRIHQVWNQLDEPTAVIGTNDNFALGAFHALRSADTIYQTISPSPALMIFLQRWSFPSSLPCVLRCRNPERSWQNCFCKERKGKTNRQRRLH